jgi:cell division septum initiation protein DivIVA
VVYNPHPVPHAGELDPDAIAARVFAESRRGGYEPTEVQAYLQVLAEEFRSMRQREHELRLQIADLERQLSDTEERASAAEGRSRSGGASAYVSSLHDLDEVELTILVGEETAKVLGAARNAASEIRANAERTAAEMHRKATEAADHVAARAEVDIQQRAADAEASLARRLDEAEAAIGAAHAEAAEQRERARLEAERSAEALVADAHQRVAEAETTAAQLVEQARTEAGAQRARAEADATEIVERANVSGRQIMDEVHELRARMLEDLLRRRKLLRRQVEQLHAGRERFLTAFDAARDAMATIDDELTRALPEARAAAEAAGQRADDHPDAPTAELESLVRPVRVADDDHPVGRAADRDDEPGDGASDVPSTSVFSRLRAEGGAASSDLSSADAAHDEPDGDDPDDSDDPDEPVAADHPVEPTVRPVPHLVVVPGHRGEPEPDAPGDDDAIDVLGSRDTLLDELTRPVVRRMKRSLTDEQNEVLDAVRRRRPLPSLDELLAPVAEHERRYAETALPGLTKSAAAGHEFPAVYAEELRGPRDTDPSTESPAERSSEVPSVRDVAAALAVDVVGGLRARLEGCLSGADLLRVDPKARPVGTKGPTKAAITAQADAVAEQVRLAYREVRTHRVDRAVTAAVQASFLRGLDDAEPADVARQLRTGLDATAAPVLVD